MKLLLGFIAIFILSVIFSFFQGFIDFLIGLGIFPEKYLHNANFDIMMIFALYVLFMVTAMLIGWLVIICSWLLDFKLTRQYKKARKRAQREFGTSAPYFYFMDASINAADINFDKSCYVYETYQNYLFEKLQDWDEVEKVSSKLSNIEELKIYHEAIDYFQLPDIPREYGIFNKYSDEDLILFNK